MDPTLVAEIKGRIGLVIGDEWKLVKILGLGASAAVYRAVNRRRQRVAVKVLHHRFLHSKVVRRRFFREQQILSRLDHPNVLKIFGTSSDTEDECYIVMELLEGRTLAKIMNKLEGPMPVEQTLEYMEPLLGVLGVCHDSNIIHRDLKPANMFLTNDDVIKLLDFGVARFHEDGVHLTRDGTALGTPAFMSPEQATGRLHMLDARSDVFSIGATMHFLLSGHYLHEGRTADETFVLAASTPAPSLASRAPHAPGIIVQLVDRAVAWDPKDRFQSVESMLHALREASNSLSPRHTPMFGAESIAGLVQESLASNASSAHDVPRVHDLLHDLFEAIRAAATAMLEHGAESAEALSGLEEAWALYEVASKDVGELVFDVLPYGFLVPGADEPFYVSAPPLDALTYNLYVCGVRSIRLLPDLSPASLAQFVAVMMLEPARDLAPEDDLGNLLWDLELAGVVVHFQTELDLLRERESAQRASYRQHAELFRSSLARHVSDERDRVHVLSIKGASDLGVHERSLAPLGPAPARPEGLTGPIVDADLARLVRAHGVQSEFWPQRVSRTLADTLADAFSRNDPEEMLSSLSELLYRMGRVGNAEDALSLVCSVLFALEDSRRSEALEGCFDAMRMCALFDALGVWRPQTERNPSPRARANLKSILRYATPAHAGAIARAMLVRRDDPSLGSALTRAMSAVVAEGAPSIGLAIKLAADDVALATMDFVIQEYDLLAVARHALNHPSHTIQTEAFERLASVRDPWLIQAIPRLTWASSGPLRLRAFRLAVTLGLSHLVPTLKEHFVDPRFHMLSEQERAMNFELLRRLSPESSLEMAARLLLWQAHPRDLGAQSSRVVATKFIAQMFPNEPITLRSLNAAAAAEPWNPDELQRVARTALALRGI